jgi:hypothetical protein
MRLSILDFFNLVVGSNLKQNIVNIYFLDHLMRPNIINKFVASFEGPKVKVFFQFFNFQMVC